MSKIIPAAFLAFALAVGGAVPASAEDFEDTYPMKKSATGVGLELSNVAVRDSTYKQPSDHIEKDVVDGSNVVIASYGTNINGKSTHTGGFADVVADQIGASRIISGGSSDKAEFDKELSSMPGKIKIRFERSLNGGAIGTHGEVGPHSDVRLANALVDSIDSKEGPSWLLDHDREGEIDIILSQKTLNRDNADDAASAISDVLRDYVKSK